MTLGLPPHFSNIPTKLLSSAFRAGQELAWPRQETLEAIDWFFRHGCAVVGIEVWLPSMSGPEIPFPIIYTWALEPSRLTDESWQVFTNRAKNKAVTYIKNFDWDKSDLAYHGREPFFNLDVIARPKISARSLALVSLAICAAVWARDKPASPAISFEESAVVASGLEEAKILGELAKEYGMPFSGPEVHPGRLFGQFPHIHVGPIDHIPVR